MLHSQSVTSCRCWRTALQKFCHPNAWMDGQAFGQVRWLINRRIPWYQFCRPWLGWASNPICSQSLIRTCRQFYASWDRSVFEEVFTRQCKVILSDEMTCKVRVRHASERRLFYFSQFGGVINLKGVCVQQIRDHGLRLVLQTIVFTCAFKERRISCHFGRSSMLCEWNRPLISLHCQNLAKLHDGSMFVGELLSGVCWGWGSGRFEFVIQGMSACGQNLWGPSHVRSSLHGRRFIHVKKTC